MVRMGIIAVYLTNDCKGFLIQVPEIVLGLASLSQVLDPSLDKFFPHVLYHAKVWSNWLWKYLPVFSLPLGKSSYVVLVGRWEARTFPARREVFLPKKRELLTRCYE